jgi:hypothetical protein
MDPNLLMLSQTFLTKGTMSLQSSTSKVCSLRAAPVRSWLQRDMQSKKRKLCKLPTIPEVELEDVVQPMQVPRCSSPAQPEQPPLLPEPMIVSNDSAQSAAILLRLKSAGLSERRALITWICSASPALAATEMGSDMVQMALKVAKGEEREVLLSSLQGSILDLCTSAHGHLVITTLIESMPISAIDFIPQELAGKGVEIAQNRFGYRVLEAMAMHCSELQLSGLAEEISQATVLLSRHMYGNFVLQHFLEYGNASCQSNVICCLITEIKLLAMDRTASNVVLKALEVIGYKSSV